MLSHRVHGHELHIISMSTSCSYLVTLAKMLVLLSSSSVEFFSSAHVILSFFAKLCRSTGLSQGEGSP